MSLSAQTSRGSLSAQTYSRANSQIARASIASNPTKQPQQQYRGSSFVFEGLGGENAPYRGTLKIVEVAK